MIYISERTLTDLEFPVIQEQLAEFCLTEMGRAKAFQVRPFPSLGATLFALHQTQEYKSSSYEADRIPNHDFDPVNKEIHLLGIDNSVLPVESFQKISVLSDTANRHLRFFQKQQILYPCLYKTTESIELTPVIVQAIEKVIDRFGEIRDEASPLLAEIRKKLHRLQAQIDSSFVSALSRYHSSGYLDEIRESIIDDKRVLAVTARYKKKVSGTILGRSKTGSIIFIQPENTLQFSRAYNNLKYEEKEEINRILKVLTEQIRPYSDLLREYQELLSLIDLIAAKVKYAQTLRAILPKITRKKELDLKAAYHPLLYLRNKQREKKTFPQDIKLDEQQRIIVISGPNAGGKSITLKTVGLLQVMLQSGLFVPVHEYSRMCLFNKVLSDIGDHQSIENQLSTYSYRLKNMRYFLKQCDDRTLFLIDEFGTGTDPELGGALAETFLEVFHERASFGIITTHYANLKKMAQETTAIINANMRFDSRSLAPEFKLIIGEAGSSFTFEVAAKNGIPYRLINRSKKKVERGKILFDKSIAQLQKERSKLAETNQKLQKEQRAASEHKEELHTKKERIQQKLEDFQQLYDSNQQLIHLGKKLEKLSKIYDHDHNRKKLNTAVLKLVEIENARRKKAKKKAREEQKKENIRKHKARQEAQHQIKKIRAQKKKTQEIIQKQAEEAEKKRIASLSIGDRVRMQGSHSIGVIERIEKGKAVINYGQFTAETLLEQLELVQHRKK